MAFDKTWLVLIAGCGVLGFALWSGINAVTVKMALLWTFITFGFLTLIMHVFGSPISIVLSKLFQSAENNKRKVPVYTHNELTERRNRAFQKKQVLQDDKVKVYKENVLRPRVEALKEKKEAEFYKFNTVWKGKGNRLGHCTEEHTEDFEDSVEEDFLDQEFLLNGNTSSEEESGTEEEFNTTESIDKSAFSMQQQDNVNDTLRQRISKQFVKLTQDEPSPTEKGVVTVALRCPDGTVKKRRFTAESKVQALVTFAEYLGYAPSRYVILMTYPRKALSDMSQTFSDAGLTHDTALVIEENPV